VQGRKKKRKEKKKKEKAVVGAGRLLQHCQLPNKYSRDISRRIYNFLRYFEMIVCFFHIISLGNPDYVLWNPKVP
jgi:hypothetical protein